MIGFIYVGFEPENFGGNDTADRAGSGGLIGAYLQVNSTRWPVYIENTFDGTINQFAPANVATKDPADYIRFSVGEFTTQMRIGVEIDTSDLFENMVLPGSGSGRYELRATATDAFSAGIRLEVTYGAQASIPETRAYFAAMDRVTAAAQRWFPLLQNPDLLTDRDRAAINSMTLALNGLTSLQLDLVDGTLGAATIDEARLDVRARMAAITAAATGLGADAAEVSAYLAAGQAAVNAGRTLALQWFTPEYRVNGRLVEDRAGDNVTITDNRFEYLLDVGVRDGDLNLQITGGITRTTDTGMVAEELDYGFGLRALAWSFPSSVNGRTTLLGSDGGDSISQGIRGANAIYGLGGADTIRAGDGADSVFGGVGADQIEGGTDADSLYGGAGNDVIIGGAGADVMQGGAGRDVFVFRGAADAGLTAAAADLIQDFARGTDRIDLSAISGQLSFIGTRSFSGERGEFRFSQSNELLLVDLTGDRVADVFIRVDGISSLARADFIL